MALSGYINGKTNNEYIAARIYWRATQSVADNTSTITAGLQYKRTNVGYTTHGNMRSSITVNGSTDSQVKEVWITEEGWTEAHTYTVVVKHNNDGTKSVSLSATGYIGHTSLDSTDVSGTITLDTIHRKATISSAPNFNDEGNPTITYSNPAGNNATTLQACISLTGAADDIVYRNISKTGTSYTFNLTAAERNVLRQATTGKTRSVRFYVKSIIGGVSALSYLEKTLTITNANPILSPSIVDSNTITTALTGDNNKLVKYFSNAAITIGATAQKYATVKSQNVVNGSKTLTANGTINAIESGSFVFSATDSRGFTASKTVSKTIVNYKKLTCDIGHNTPATDGTFNFEVSGNYFNGSFGAVNNSLAVYYRFKAGSGNYSSWAAMAITKSGDSYTANVNLTGLDYRETYTFQAYAKDALITIYSEEKAIKSTPVFDWGKDDFNINGTVSINNNVVLRNNQDYNSTVISADGSTIHLRPNGTFSSSGELIVYANGNVAVEGNLLLNGVPLGGSNTVLWSGAAYMTGSQTITLSKPVSEQANGIVLIFSRYNGTAADEANFNHFFVSKYFVANKGGTGSAFTMATVNFSVVASKYLYINDTTIKGNDLNTASGTGTSGIKYDNSGYCLRYVIGV